MAYTQASKANNNAIDAVKSEARDVTRAYPEVQDIQSDLVALKEDVTKLSKHVYRDGPVQFRELAKKKIEQVRHHVEEKPAQALAVAFFSGLPKTTEPLSIR